MSENPKCEVMVIHEGVVQSLVRDAGTFATFIALIGIGWFLQSEAMQWTGAALGFFAVFYLATGTKRFTIEEARAELDRLESQS